MVAADVGVQHLARDEWARHPDEVMQRAADWALLLQIDLAGWMQASLVEGSVYFLIRREDLAARRFEAAVTVYQQS